MWWDVVVVVMSPHRSLGGIRVQSTSLHVKLQGAVEESQVISTDFQPPKVDFGCPNLMTEVDLDTANKG